MDRSAREFLKKLAESPSPSGFEQPAAQVIRERMKGFADEVRTDVNGNVIGVVNGDAPLRVMLAGHSDEIGLMITHIDEKGYLYFAAIGGIDPAVLGGQTVEIHAEKGLVPGVIGRKAVHLMEPEERGKPSKIHEYWIDIGAKDKKDAEKVVAVGSPITITRRFLELRNGFVAARGFDDRVGAWTVVETLRRMKKTRPRVGVFAVATVQEELGLRGARTAAFGIMPHVGIAVDVGFASDYPDSNKKLVGDVGLGRGPILHRGANINPALATLMEKTGRRKKIPFQLQAEPRATGTDANVMQMNGAGAATALLSIPNRYMHTPVEVVSLNDMDKAVDLLTATIAELRPGMDFTPR